MIAIQLGLALDKPEPIAKRQRQRELQRDDVLDLLQQLRAELVAIADRIAPSVQAQYGSVTGPRLLLAMEAAGYGAMLAKVPRVWVAGVLLPSRGWRAVGEAREGSNARPVKTWVKV